MAITLRHIDGYPEHATNPLYHHVSIAEGIKMVFMSGQVAWNAEGASFVEQVEDAYVNVGKALAGAGATFTDVVKLMIYVVDWNQSMIPDLVEGVTRAMRRIGSTATPPATLIGVTSLDVPEHVVEIEATAVI